jgi:hypothetical protein
MIPVLLLGDGSDDVGRQPGTAGAPLAERQWGPLHVLVAFTLRDAGIYDFAFLRPLPAAAVLRNGVGRAPLPRYQQFYKQFGFFLDLLSTASGRGLVVIINDQDCDPRRLEWLDGDANQAIRGMSTEVLVTVTAVAVECTESWLLCGSWPAAHSACKGVEHPSLLGCENNKNRAKHVFDQLHGGGWQRRSGMARHITRHPQASECQRLREAPDFRLLERKIEEALLRLL